jgi:hypothetical protein
MASNDPLPSSINPDLQYVNLYRREEDGSRYRIFSLFSRKLLKESSRYFEANLKPGQMDFEFPLDSPPRQAIQRVLFFLRNPVDKDGVQQIRLRPTDDFASAIELHWALLYFELKPELTRHPNLRSYLLNYICNGLPKEAIAKIYITFHDKDHQLVETMVQSFVNTANIREAEGDAEYSKVHMQYFDIYAPGMAAWVRSMYQPADPGPLTAQADEQEENRAPVAKKLPDLPVTTSRTGSTASTEVAPAPKLAFPVKATIQPKKGTPKKPAQYKGFVS